MRKINKVCVYAASSPYVDEKYFAATESLANSLVDNNVTVVYGGGAVGLMGHLADTVVAREGRIIGIMPNFMKKVELNHKAVTEFIFVGDMHERKKRFLEEVNGVIALPGGCGTFEELLEVITLKRLGLFMEPIIIYNINGYYDPLIQMLEKSIEEKFLKPKHRMMWTVLNEGDDVMEALQNAPEWTEELVNLKGYANLENKKRP
ncbi:TIGR00730 family Rossman fold protein [Roseivirga sp. BDSF3-8]|uniref:LOG family protein n=1 Tax=Roseivirga sp. BDSF3-8 TaxID=3241598 RepID=UPI003532605D